MKRLLPLAALVLAGLQFSALVGYGQLTTISLSGGTYTPAGGDTVFNGTTTLTSSAATVTIGGVITGAASMTISSASVTIGGANTYTGATTLGGTGTLNLTTANLAAASAVQFNGVGSLVYNQNLDGTASNTITDIAGGFGSVVKNGTATLTLSSAANSYNATVINSGTLALSSTGKLGNATTSGTVTLTGGTLNLNSTTQTVANVTVSAGQITSGTLSATGVFNLLGGSISSALTGAAALSVSSSATVTLAGANTFTGGTTLSAGTLALGSAGAIGAAGTISFSGGTLQFSAANTTDLSARFSNAASQLYNLDTNSQSVTLATALTSVGGSLTKSGAGTLTLTGANTFTGGTTLNTGTLVVTATSLPGNAALTASTSALVFNQAANGTFAGVISGAGTLVKQGAGTLTLSGANTFTGGTTLSTGTLVVSAASLPGNIALAVTSSALVFNQTTAGTFAGAITGSGSVTALGGSTLTLTNTNSYTGGTTVNAGTLIVSTASLPGNVALTASTSALVFNQVAVGTFAGVISGTGTLTAQGGSTLTLSGANTFTGGTTLNAGTLVVTATSLPGSIALATTSSALVFNQTSAGTFAGVISGTGTLTAQGGSTLTLSGANTFTGGTTVSTGTLVVNTASLPGDIALTATNSALVFNQTTAGTFAGVISGAGTLAAQGGSTLTLSGANTFTGGTTLNSGTLVVTAASLPGSVALATTSSALVFNQTTAGTFAGVISGAGSFTNQGTGILTLTGANIYTGVTTLSAGRLILGSAGAIGTTGTISFGGGSLEFSASNTTDYSNRFSSAAGQLYRVNTSGQAVTLASALTSVGGSLAVSGTGTLTLTGANTYAGGTTVNNTGTLAVTVASLPGNVVLSNSSTLLFNQTTGGTFAGVISGTGTLAVQGGSTLTLTGANTFTGGTTAGSGTLVVNTTSLPGDVALTATSSALVFNQTTAGTYAGVISGAGTLTKQGAGTLTLTGANTFAGGTTISTGTLAVGSTSQLGTTSGGIVLNGGTLANTAGSNAIARAITFTANGGGLNNGGSGKTLDLTGSRLVLGATLTSSTVTFSGGGTTQLTSGSFASGLAFNLTAGTLLLNTTSTAALIANNFSINSATLSINPLAGVNNVTLSGVVTGNGTITFSGTGTLTLSGTNNAFTGTFAAPSGTLTGDTGSIVGNVVSTGTVAFNQTADGTFSGTLTGGGLLVKTGAGALTLANSTSSPIDLRTGTIFLDTVGGTPGGSGTVTISSGALFGGNGTVTGNLINNGTLSPGHSPGTITVSGNFTQAAGGTTVIQLASLASFDHLAISGSATLNGTLQVDTLGGFTPTVSNTFAFLTAAGGVTGSFSSVTGSALIAPGTAVISTVSYGATTVTLAYVQLPFSGFAVTPNQVAIATGAALDPVASAALNAVPTGQLPAALNALSPQGYQVWSNIAFARSTALAGRLARDSAATPGHDSAYFEASQRRGRTNGDADVGQSTFTTNEGLLGGDRVVGPNLTLGALFSYGEGTSDLGAPGSSTTVKDYTLGTRAAWTRGSWFAHGLVAYGFDTYHGTRPITFPGTAATADASTQGQQWTLAVSAGRHVARGPWTLSPFVGAQASGWQANAFTETGAGAFNSALARQSATSFRTQFGLDGGADLEVGSLQLPLHFRAAWLHEWSDNARPITATVGTSGYTVTTRGPQRDSALLGAGFDVVLGPRSLIYTDFTAQTGSVTRVLGEWRAGVSVRF